MLTLPASVHIYLAISPVDLRRGHDGLSAIVMGIDKVLRESGGYLTAHQLKAELTQPSTVHARYTLCDFTETRRQPPWRRPGSPRPLGYAHPPRATLARPAGGT